ncbi:MAG: hypothetical protein [Bacteriophage sp.]|nr:MAG: hypothetical protein [Bacteriophage sp.]
MADIRINDLPETLTPSASDNVAIDGATTRRTTAKKLVDAGAPVASQAEAEAGTDAEKRMTPLTTKQSIASEVGVTLASAEQGALAGSAVQPSDIGTTAGTVAAGDDSRIIDAYKSLSESAGTSAARERVSAVAAQNTTALPDEGIGAPLDPPLVPFAATAAKTYEFSEQKTTHGGAFFTKALIKKSSGSGEFGPQSADGALILSAEKVTYTGGTETGDWKTAQGEGEIDTLIVVARQGHKGDTAGIAVDVRKVRTGASGETGGGTPIEIASAIVNESDVPSLSMHWIPGMTESAAGLSAGKGYGSFVETRAGRWYAAYYAGNVGASSPINENPSLGSDIFDYLMVGSTSRDPSGADVYFAIEANILGGSPGGILIGKPSNRRVIRFDADTGVFSVRKQDGTFLFTLDALGNASFAVGVQIGSGSVQQYLKTVSGSFDPPSIAAFATVDLVELDCPGSLPGDMVTACCTSTLGVFASLQLTGVVYSANKVTLRGRNTTNAAVDYANFPYTIKVERFVA